MEHVAVGVAGYAHVHTHRESETNRNKDSESETHTHTDTRHYPRYSLKHTNLHKTHKNNTLTIPPMDYTSVPSTHTHKHMAHTLTHIALTHAHKIGKNPFIHLFFFMLETLNCKLFACLPATNVKLGSQGGRGEGKGEKSGFSKGHNPILTERMGWMLRSRAVHSEFSPLPLLCQGVCSSVP